MSQTKKARLWIIFCLFIIFVLSMVFFAVQYTINHSAIPPKKTDTIGGGFQLISPAGSIVNDGIFRGKWMLLYFGATRCPEHVCYNNLRKLGEIVEKLGNQSSKIAPIFISFDMNYDTPSRLMLTMKNFNNKIIALTGGEFALRDLSIMYHVPIQKIKLTDTTSFIQPYDQFILMNPKGQYNRSIKINTPTDQIVQNIQTIIN